MPGYRRRYNCRCGKKRYRDEPSALAAAAADREAHGEEVTVYRCPGGLAWHLTTRGFTPEALPSLGRRLAFELIRSGPEGVPPGSLTNDDPRRRNRLDRCAAQLVELGLARWRDDRLHAVDVTGLNRVVQIGLDAYAASAGLVDPA